MADGTATDLHVPVPTIVAGMHGIEVTVPMMVLVTQGVAATVPAPTITGTILSSYDTAELTSPAMTISGTGTSGLAGTIDAVVPAPIIEAYSAPEAALVAPAPTVEATGLAGILATLERSLPAPTITGTIIPSNFMSAALVVPAPTLAASGLVYGIGSASLSVRMAVLTATGLTGAVGEAALEAPAPTLSGTGYGAYDLTAALVAPAYVMSGSLLVPAPAANFRTWVLNVRKKGLTEYDGTAFQFNSYATFRGIVLGASDAGVFKLDTTDTDNTAKIVAVVRTGQHDFGTTFNKRVPRIYVGVECTNNLHFSTLISQSGKRTYLLQGNKLPGIQQRRVPIGRGPKSPYWQFEMSNPDGADFLLDHMSVRPEKSQRRVV